LENDNPKKDLRLPFSLVRLPSASSSPRAGFLGSFGQAKEMNIVLGAQKMNK
jgi:hypothetical protein